MTAEISDAQIEKNRTEDLRLWDDDVLAFYKTKRAEFEARWRETHPDTDPPDTWPPAADKLRDVVGGIAGLSYHQLRHLDELCSDLMRFIRAEQDFISADPSDPPERSWSRYRRGDPKPRSGKWWGNDPIYGYDLRRRDWPAEDGVPALRDYSMEQWELGNDEILDLAALIESGWDVWVHAEYANRRPGYGMSISFSKWDEASVAEN